METTMERRRAHVRQLLATLGKVTVAPLAVLMATAVVALRSGARPLSPEPPQSVF